jgi:hypothetical protein
VSLSLHALFNLPIKSRVALFGILVLARMSQSACRVINADITRSSLNIFINI